MLAYYNDNKTVVHAIVLVGVLGVAAGAMVLHSTPLCACASPAQMILGHDWPDMDAQRLQARAAQRFPRGMSAEQVRERIHPSTYARYCKEEGVGQNVLCTLPSDRSYRGERHARLALAFDDDNTLRNVTVSALVRK